MYSWNETLHVSDSSSVHHQEFFTVHTTMVYVIQVCCPSKPVWQTPDDGQRNCPKHVEFHSKNKFKKLVHVVDFIIRNLSWCTVTWTSNTACSLSADSLLSSRYRRCLAACYDAAHSAVVRPSHLHFNRNSVYMYIWKRLGEKIY